MPYIHSSNISSSLNSPIHTHSIDTPHPLRLPEDITQTAPTTHPRHHTHPLHALPISPATHDYLVETFDTLRFADISHSNHDQSIVRIAPYLRRFDRSITNYHPHTTRCAPHDNRPYLTMPACRTSPGGGPLPGPYTYNRNLDRAATMLLRVATRPVPFTVLSTAAERGLLSRGSTVARLDRGANIWPRITGLGGQSNSYQVIRANYQEEFEYDALFSAMDSAWCAVYNHAIFESYNTGSPTLASIATRKVYEENLKRSIHALYLQSSALYQVNRARVWANETFDLAAYTDLRRLLIRAEAIKAGVTALGRNYHDDKVAWQDIIQKLHAASRRPPRAAPFQQVVQAVGGDINMSPSSPIVATTSPGPGFQSALERQIRSRRGTSRTARRLPNIPSSLVDPHSSHQVIEAGEFPSSSPIQAQLEDPRPPVISLLRSDQLPAQSPAEDQSTLNAVNVRLQSPISPPGPERLSPHQGASPIAPDGSDWPIDNGSDGTESNLGEDAVVQPIADSPGRAARGALSFVYLDRVRVYGVERYRYLLAHPYDAAWDVIITRRTPPVLRFHPSEARRYWAMPVAEDEIEEAV